MLRHYRGKKHLYSYFREAKEDETVNREEHKNGLYFTTDTNEIYLNGVKYGGESDLKTTSEIRISGGPLAYEFSKDYNTNSAGLTELQKEGWHDSKGYKIPANSSLTDIIRLLFESETWGFF